MIMLVQDAFFSLLDWIKIPSNIFIEAHVMHPSFSFVRFQLLLMNIVLQFQKIVFFFAKKEKKY